MQWRGVFGVASEGYYTFASSSDDGSASPSPSPSLSLPPSLTPSPWRGVCGVAQEGYYTFASSSDDGSVSPSPSPLQEMVIAAERGVNKGRQRAFKDRKAPF